MPQVDRNGITKSSDPSCEKLLANTVAESIELGDMRNW